MKKILIHTGFKYIIFEFNDWFFLRKYYREKKWWFFLHKQLKLPLNLTLGQYTMNSGNTKLTPEHSKTHH